MGHEPLESERILPAQWPCARVPVLRLGGQGFKSHPSHDFQLVRSVLQKINMFILHFVCVCYLNSYEGPTIDTDIYLYQFHFSLGALEFEVRPRLRSIQTLKDVTTTTCHSMWQTTCHRTGCLPLVFSPLSKTSESLEMESVITQFVEAKARKVKFQYASRPGTSIFLFFSCIFFYYFSNFFGGEKSLTLHF